jgi:hypothetical protein
MPAKHEAKKVRANCVSGLLDGGLKGRLQARLPSPQGCRLHAINPKKAVAALPANLRPVGFSSAARFTGELAASPCE